MAADPGCCSSRAHRLDGIRRPSRTPLTETSQQAPGCELPVKARAYHATVDVAQTPAFAGVRSCWEVPLEEPVATRLSTRTSGSVFTCRTGNGPVGRRIPKSPGSLE